MKVVALCGKFTPHHVARFAAARILGHERGHRLIGLAVAGRQSDYRWSVASQQTACDRLLTLFPNDDYWQLSYRQVRTTLNQVLDRLKPDVVILPGWSFKESLAGLRWALRVNAGRVVLSDSQAIDTAPSRTRNLVKSFLVKRFHAALVGGTPHRRYLRELGLRDNDCFVGCDVVDNQFFAANTATRSFSHTKPARLLSCIRLLPRKNILSVLDALATRPDWCWTIAGDGPERAAIDERVRKLALSSRVKLLGHVDYYALPSVYANADIYLQPSLVEPWGMAVNEAMAAGLPVLVSDRCGCHEDLVQDDVNGYVFAPTSVAAIGAALDHALAERRRWFAMGGASREIINHWNLHLFAKNLWRACSHAHERYHRNHSPSILDQALALGLRL